MVPEFGFVWQLERKGEGEEVRGSTAGAAKPIRAVPLKALLWGFPPLPTTGHSIHLILPLRGGNIPLARLRGIYQKYRKQWHAADQ